MFELRHSTSRAVTFSAFGSLLLLVILLVGVSNPTIAEINQYSQQAQQMYVAYYGRPGDPVGIDYWGGRLDEVGGNWINDLVNAFGASKEYTERYEDLAADDLIDNLYNQLFNRLADSVGRDFYIDLLNGSNSSGLNPLQRRSTLAQIALDIANGASSLDKLILDNKLNVAAQFTDVAQATGRFYTNAEIPCAIDIIGSVDETLASIAIAIARIDYCLPGGVTIQLNDTGIVACSSWATTDLPCPVSSHPGQDAEYGRDVTYSNDSDGHAGFSLTKLDANGTPQSASVTSWSCVQDNVTGLVWEVKTDDGGLQDKDNTYTWYNPDSASNGGSSGTPNGGLCAGANCDTESFIQAVNMLGLCGFDDWRLPNALELLSIVNNHQVSPAADVAYFPNTVSWEYWSSSPYANRIDYAWLVEFGYGHLYYYGNKSSDMRVRLVRSER